MEDQNSAYSIEHSTQWSGRIRPGSWLFAPAVARRYEITGDSSASSTLLPPQDSLGNLDYGGIRDFISHSYLHRSGALFSGVLAPKIQSYHHMSEDGDLPGYRLAASSCGCAIQILVEPSSRRHHRWFSHHCLFAVEHLGVLQDISFCQTSHHPDPKYNILLASIWLHHGNFKIQQDGRYHGISSSDFDRQLCVIRRRY